VPNILDRFLGRTTQAAARPLVAAAARLDRPTPEAKRQAKIKAQAWQERAWQMFDSVGLVHYPYSQAADAGSRVRLFVAVEPAPGETPIPIENAVDEVEGITQSLADAAIGLFDRVQDDEGGRAEIQREGVLNLKVPGELVLVMEEEEDGTERCFVVASTALQAKDGVNATGERSTIWTVMEGPEDRKGRELPPDRTNLIRIWRRHGQWPRVADSNMRALLDDLEELQLMKAEGRALAQSRIANTGLLVMDKRIQFAGGKFTPEILGRIMATAISDPGSGEAVVPPILDLDPQGLPGGVKDALHHVTLDRPRSKEDAARWTQVVLSVARGIDAPPEYVLGLGDSSTYANAKLISRENYDSHLGPTISLLAGGIASGWVVPGLEAMMFPQELARRVMIAADPGSILARPEPVVSTDSGVTLYTSRLVTKNEARAEYGWSPVEDGDDFVSDEELAAIGGGPAPAFGATEPSEDNPNGDDQDMALAAAVHPQAITAASRPANPYAKLGRRLGDIDRALLDRTAVAASAALDNALNMAGARLRSQASRSTYRDRLGKGTPSHAVPAALGSEAVAALTADAGTDPLFAGAFDRFEEQWRAEVRKAQRFADAAVLAYADGYDDTAQTAQRERDLDASWGVLAAGLIAAAGARLLDPTVTAPPSGEFDDTLSLNTGIVRDALRVAGGGPGTVAGAAGSPEAVGLVATGPTTRDLALAALDARGDEWTWVYGYPDRPFEPHAALDGVTFTDWQDPVLSNPGDWPAVDRLFPSDHDGCTCLAFPTFTAGDGLALAAAGVDATT
jgi:hypothetical protein